MKTQLQSFIETFNEAFAQKNLDVIANSVTDDVVWKMVGERTVSGKEAMIHMLKDMDDGQVYKLTIDYIITHGKIASANGRMETSDQSGSTYVYEFCDVYQLNKHKGGKIQK
ncbi:nuclear transport factor 2 family protein [Bacillus sp. JCM 19034]|uniref:nuclear transport factor 2 family protein n=1 Tax=Bacillus sp. JCM 19034 TaxID=1481928 RepID=UPI000B125842|nr:nuclear transport factor 2 family protein [Bacillus sp. JCM 19034]